MRQGSRLYLGLLIFLTALALVGCASSSRDQSESYTSDSLAARGGPAPAPAAQMAAEVAMTSAPESKAMEMPMLASASGGVSGAVEVERKIVRSAEIVQETEAFDADLQRVRDTVAQLDGYFEGTDISGSAATGTRVANMAVRVPVGQFDAAMGMMREIGKPVRESSSETDMTANYVDNDIRIGVLTQNLEKLEELQKAAEDVESIIYLQQRMNEILIELDGLQASQRYIIRRAEESTIRFSLFEYKVTVIEPVDETLSGRMGQGFARTANGVLRFLESAAVFLVAAIPVLLLLAALAGVALLIVFIVRRVSRRGKKKNPDPEEDKGPQ